MSHIQFGNSKIKYTVIRSNRRKTSEIIVSKSGVDVLSPMNKNDTQIKKLVKSHSKWIYQKQLRVMEESNEKNTYVHNSKLPYLGKKYLLKTIKSRGDNSFSFTKGVFVARVTNTTKSHIKSLYVEWSKKKVFGIIMDSILKYEKKLKIGIPKIYIKKQKNRWGSVNKNKTINFNYDLVCAPQKILDYVVAHELCHLLVPDHSERYWRLLHSIMPDYENRKEWLRIHKNNP